MTYEGETGFRVGDVVSVACPFTPAVVEQGVRHGCVSVRWPWWRIDAGSDFHRWNGVVALGVDTERSVVPEGEVELFRTEPAPEHLAAGDACLVGVPPTVVHVTWVGRHDPPQETGWLPRPGMTVCVLPRGLSYREFPDGSHLDGWGYGLHPENGIPYAFELLMRPYAFLEPGDEVGDGAGRAWRFEGPWDWVPFDGAPPGAGPGWPLVLLARAGAPCPAGDAAAAAVAAGTAAGSHQETVRQWMSLTGASPTP
ncbi:MULTISPECIES: hypothetical protein [Streptomyces]|uniref:hypothetical protein n=1 Tax=Streptomyces TaxID=1883 RepID=UPI000F7A53B7|nr:MULTISPECIES: hypothetical protein [Streptomyces]RST00105.1 hypothetical protein EF910_33000 [Streptomyces sp. WAC07149]GLX23699.1 hypothetical protein Slala01_73430 [Streptomyces lavendulae subsp. lavendulae]GLX31748.1 hypothetical protein Slala02_75670 [Streptomyces lavendulae subsp. lavendulae]